ncbi:ABC transporter ATP-binding protein [Alsobacter sp. SYSU M60028]|uniref:ABC transporter ATP-binding protein n=1 Tax=Alsobacter ponti TaxID=2962936 RepID=A0ABT1LD38_9HYPH|nr:ABC transporter ATP-binding protein [Alsobacter ponti]MCP8938163.1 ABC transporter ATP-binding protein [Alsobacter ponti]
MLQVRQVVKSFGRMNAVDGADFAVPQGSITGLIGPNGAGKTTLFNLIAGSLIPDSGTIVFDGQRIDGLTPDRVFHRGLARTFQIPRPFPKMTVLENAMLAPTRQAGEVFWSNWLRPGLVAAQEKANRDRAVEVLGFCGLGSKLSELAGNLSGGQQKLLELARVLMNEPRMILLDEPAAGVNPTLMETLVDKIVALNRRGITFLLIEHNMDLVMRICRPIVVMAQGKVIFEGEAEAVQRDARVLDAYLGDLPA